MMIIEPRLTKNGRRIVIEDLYTMRKVFVDRLTKGKTQQTLLADLRRELDAALDAEVAASERRSALEEAVSWVECGGVIEKIR